MNGNGVKIGLTVFFLAICGYYLYPTAQNFMLTNKLNELSPEAREQYIADNAQYIRDVRNSSLQLGLDLQGGMHVTLQVRVAALLDQLATNKDAAFREVLQAARQQAAAQGTSVVEAFLTQFQQRDGQVRLSRYFRNETANITRRSTNEEVAEYLRQQVDEAVDRAMEVVRNRVDQYGVSEPSIQKKGSRRISVELPGVDNPDRVRNLLEGAARLTFHLTAEPQALTQSAQDIIAYYEPDTTGTADTTAVDTVAADPQAGGDPVPETQGTSLVDPTDTTAGGDQGTALTGPSGDAQNPLLAVLQPLPYRQQPVLGQAFARDTARVNDLLQRPAVQRMLPNGVRLMWTANPAPGAPGGQEAYNLIGVQAESELSGEVIESASVQFDQFTNEPSVSMTMNSDGARIWARLTGANVGEQVAVVLDGKVYSYPRIQERIAGGRTSISGLESRAEAQDIVTILQSGALPAPLDIIEERTVGPSLGEASIRAGFISAVVGLLLVALFMIFYYRTAGIVADVALLLNIVLILGVLAAFNATLTLPGIAGIVLTIGMAVDANVLIFERIREEMATGKTERAALEAGYDKALSAILDANITTFFTGVILYSFGVGPIQGFAVTLMIGILASLFTAIIVTRIVFDYLMDTRGVTSINYG
ncbi:protein translocase subunit SecD [Salisaeta longa]|uniref:protein translocase subunit SecD n=1 Tax=Salisaeta longa TaxID=503170 RepID=UPI0003B49D8B|nr:protein translocase subunit SecD [Salisaeta longa]